MNFTMNIPGLKGVTVHKIEEFGERIALYVSLPKKEHQCPACNKMTAKIHDYRVQKIKHLKWFERLRILFYKRRRYVCECGKRFSGYSKEWNQVVGIRSVKAKTFKETAEVLGTSSSTVVNVNPK